MSVHGARSARKKLITTAVVKKNPIALLPRGGKKPATNTRRIVPPDVRILGNIDAIAKRAAQDFVQSATQAVSEKGSFSVALSGGSTPKALYSLLANDAAL